MPCAGPSASPVSATSSDRTPAASPPSRSVLTARSSSPGARTGVSRISRSDDGSEVAALDAHDVPVRITTFDPSGERVLTAADDGTMRLWDAATGALVAELAGHTDRVQSAVFSPDGRRLLTSGDTTARLWDTSTGRSLRVVGDGEFALVSAAFLPDGEQILTASDGNGAQIWDLESGTSRPFGDAGAQLFSAEVNADGTRAVRARAWAPPPSGTADGGRGRRPRTRHDRGDRSGGAPCRRGPHRWLGLDLRRRLGGRGRRPPRPRGALARRPLQPRRPARHHRRGRPDGTSVVGHRRPRRRAPRPHRQRGRRGDQPGRDAGRHRQRGRDRQDLGPRRGPRARGARRRDPGRHHQRLVQPRRQHRPGLAEGRPPCGSGTPTPARRCWPATAARSSRRSLPCLSGAVVLEQASTVNETTFSPDGSMVATAGEQQHGPPLRGRHRQSTSRPCGATTDRSGRSRSARTGDASSRRRSDQSARIWDTATGRELQSLAHPGGGLADAAFSPDGATVATSGGTTVVFWDAETGVERWRRTCRPRR